jgi:hypothetical protein
MKLAFFTESRYYGKISLPNNNLRVDLAWKYLLSADNIYLYGDLDNIPAYDIGVIILPKNRVDINLKLIKSKCKKVAIMQEGPSDIWTDYTIIDQVSHLNLLNSVDFLLCHNSLDQKYYIGLTGKATYIMPSVLVEESLIGLQFKSIEERKKDMSVIVGGNMCSWYNGMVSVIIAKNINAQVTMPSMGRKVPGEERIEGVTHLKYMEWKDWMYTLNEFSVGVHAMPTSAAGTFSLNCAYLGIPCIGNQEIDTQNICHPLLAANNKDLDQYIDMAIALKHKPEFYDMCSEQAQSLYNEKFHSSIFLRRMTEIFEIEFNK